MGAAHKTLAFQDLQRLFRRGGVATGDGALLHGFLAGGDEAAFEALVSRHGPMVLGVCRRVLASPHDADDAFQATFLVLLKKGRQLRDADRLGPWLHGVATRVATKARAQAARRRYEPLPDLPAGDDTSPELADVRPILDAELGRLSAPHREVLVLCLLEGATAEEAARRLACPVGTVKSRLARGREILRARLAGRGVAPASALAAVMSTFASPVSAALIRSTLVAGVSNPAALPPAVVALTRGVAPSMLTKSSVMAVAVIGGLAALTSLGMPPVLKSLAVASAGTQDLPAGGPASPRGKGAGVPATKREESINHLKQLMLGLHNHEAAYTRFPAAAIYGPDGQPLLSWRVAILPFIDEAELYNEFRKDEPWDSPHNRPLAGRMPAIFATPHSPTAPGTTRIQGFQGESAFFHGRTGSEMVGITDGLSFTVVLALSETPVIWTKPGDMPFVDGAPLPALDETDPKGYLIAMADGAVHTLPKKAQGMPQLLGFLITRNGGEAAQFPPPAAPAWGSGVPTPGGLAPPGGGVFAGGAPGGAGMGPREMLLDSPPGVEERLRRLEEKLDLVIKKLDTLGGSPDRGGPVK